MTGTEVDYDQARYFDALLACLDEITAAATIGDRERFLYQSVRRVLVRFVQDPTDRPGFAELGVDAVLADVRSADTTDIYAAAVEEGQRLDRSITAGDERLAATSGAVEARRVTAADIEKALADLGYPQAAVHSVQVALGGRSKETILITADGVGALPFDLVLRRDLQLSSLGTTVAKEYSLLKALHAVGAPTPEPYALVEGANVIGTPFVLLQRMSGVTGARSLLAPASSAGQAVAAARTLARLHRIPLDAVDAALGRSAATPAGEVTRADVDALVTEWDERARGTSATVEAAVRWLREQVPVGIGEPVLVHGDFSFHNLLFDDDRLTAVLDWELAHAGHAAEDLGYLKPAVAPVLPWAQFMAEYRDAGGADVDARSVHFFGLYGTLRLLVQMLRAREFFESGRTDDVLKADNTAFWLPRVMRKLAREMGEVIAESGRP